jgi:NADPH:quinone reductase-like Zn-dependent oxidoreductase
MRVWEVQDDWGINQLRMIERPDPGRPGQGEVAIRMHAASINYRDLVTVLNTAPFGRLPQIPLSDGAGEVIGVGEGVIRFQIGDRVCPMLSLDWLDGPPSADNRIVNRGSATAPGVLQDILISEAEAVSRAPANLSWLEAATLPCAALTAWRAVVAEGRIGPGDVVVAQGTGGVSIFALQFAKMLGATVIITSSSDAKLERARALGADHAVNYRDNPAWGEAVLEITGGRGADLVVEVGGAETINQSIVAASVGGTIVIVGVLGGRSQELLLPAIFGKNLHLIGISIGSRRQFEDMVAAIERHDIKPVIGEVHPFGDVPEALHAMKAATHFGKICIDYSG